MAKPEGISFAGRKKAGTISGLFSVVLMVTIFFLSPQQGTFAVYLAEATLLVVLLVFEAGENEGRWLCSIRFNGQGTAKTRTANAIKIPEEKLHPDNNDLCMRLFIFCKETRAVFKDCPCGY